MRQMSKRKKIIRAVILEAVGVTIATVLFYFGPRQKLSLWHSLLQAFWLITSLVVMKLVATLSNNDTKSVIKATIYSCLFSSVMFFISIILTVGSKFVFLLILFSILVGSIFGIGTLLIKYFTIKKLEEMGIQQDSYIQEGK
ncbi:hypothetical protein J7K99_01375 [bacterium]|nr:hypothetical protein [bacterium]